MVIDICVGSIWFEFGFVIEVVWMTVLSLQQSTSVALKTAEGSTTDLATEIENIVKEKMVSDCGSHRAWFLLLLLLCMCKVSYCVSHQLTLCMEHSLAHCRNLLYIQNTVL